MSSKAIIAIARGHAPENNDPDPWNNMLKQNASLIYSALRLRGFTESNIRILSSFSIDVDCDSSYENYGGSTPTPVTESSIASALSWASGADDVVFVYIGHGGVDELYPNYPNANATISTTAMDGYFDTLNNSISGDLYIVIDSCHSGSHVDNWVPPFGKKRYVITASNSSQNSWFTEEFNAARAFFLMIANGDSLYRACSAIQAMMGYAQTYQVNVDGDTVANESVDYAISNTITIGSETSYTSLGSLSGWDIIMVDGPGSSNGYPETSVSTNIHNLLHRALLAAGKSTSEIKRISSSTSAIGYPVSATLATVQQEIANSASNNKPLIISLYGGSDQVGVFKLAYGQSITSSQMNTAIDSLNSANQNKSIFLFVDCPYSGKFVEETFNQLGTKPRVYASSTTSSQNGISYFSKNGLISFPFFLASTVLSHIPMDTDIPTYNMKDVFDLVRLYASAYVTQTLNGDGDSVLTEKEDLSELSDIDILI